MIQLSMACKKWVPKAARRESDFLGKRVLGYRWDAWNTLSSASTKIIACGATSCALVAALRSCVLLLAAAGPGARGAPAAAPAAGRGGRGRLVYVSDRELSSRDDMQAIRRAWNVAPRSGQY